MSKKKGAGLPIKILHEAVDLIVSIELVTGDIYRGTLIEMEDNMNCQLENLTVTAKDGQVSKLERVYIRGSQIVFFVLPELLQNAPMFSTSASSTQGFGKLRPRLKSTSRPSSSSSSSSSSSNNFSKRQRT